VVKNADGRGLLEQRFGCFLGLFYQRGQACRPSLHDGLIELISLMSALIPPGPCGTSTVPSFQRIRHNQSTGQRRRVPPCRCPPFRTRASFSPPDEPRLLLHVTSYPPGLLLKACGTGEPCRLDGVIWPKDGCASIASAAMAARDFLPLGFAHSSRAKKVAPLPSSAALWPEDGCGGDHLRPADRHRDRDGRGLGQPRRVDMANIGTFKKSGDDFQGEIVTLSLQSRGVRIVPETNRVSDNAPSHRVYVSRAEIGAAWSKRSNEGRDYLSVKLDDPSFMAPIYANLVEDGEAFALIWSRTRRQNGD